MALPRFMAIKSNYNNKYLRYINEDGEVHGLHRFSGEEVVSPYAKYQVVMAKSGKGLVHIRCCYNNKYWVRWSPSHWCIAAAADEPEEDQSKWSCTLFEPIYVHGDSGGGGGGNGDAKKVVRIRHVQLRHYACLRRASPPYDSCLFAAASTQDNDQCDVYTIFNWESLLILPKHVAFKGDNGYYLSARTTVGHPYLKFASNDIGDETVGNEVFTARDGSVRIKSDLFGKFWRRSPNWIWADSDDTTRNNSDTLFWPIKVEKNVIALRNLGNNHFCKRLATDGLTNCINAGICTISIEARLEVTELVISRNIYNVNFRFMDARIYNKSVVTMATGDAINWTLESNTIDLKLSYTETKSNTWNSSISLKLGVKTNIETGVPLIVKGEIESSTEINKEYQWGETEAATTVMENVYKVIVPPMSKVSVRLLATKGSCDVPFSYTQFDTLTNRQQITYNMDDSVYTGINCFDFKYETNQEKL